jgi:hypothetical protein
MYAHVADLHHTKEKERMKRVLTTAAAALMLCATVALAATPAAPVMTMTVKATKVADTSWWQLPKGSNVVIDGNNAYVAFAGPNGVSISRSTDGGQTWGVPVVLSTTGSAVQIAKAKDPLQTGKNILVAAWSETDSLRYSYYVERPTGSGWSVPLVIPGASVSSDTVSASSIRIGAAPNGSVYLFFNNTDNASFSFVKATSAETAFSSPALLPFATNVSDNYSIAFDSSNNVYVVDSTNGLSFSKYTAATSTWTTKQVDTPTRVDTTGVSIAVYDANTIYVAYKVLDAVTNPSPDMYANITIWVAATTDGGKSWTKRIVTPNGTVYGTQPVVAVNSSKVVYVGGLYVEWGPAGRITINKSSDNGATWSTNVSVPGNTGINIALDSVGKLSVISVSDNSGDLDPKFFTGITTTGPGYPVYFTREK